MSEQERPFSNFKKLEISPNCAKKISRIQTSFERLSNHLINICRENKESTQGVIRLQEACVWFCRSVAIMSAYNLQQKAKAELEKDLPKIEEEYIEEEGDSIGNKEPEKEPIVVIKKKRTFTKA